MPPFVCCYDVAFHVVNFPVSVQPYGYASSTRALHYSESLVGDALMGSRLFRLAFRDIPRCPRLID